MSDERFTRVIGLDTHPYYGPLSWHAGDGWGAELRLTPELLARIAALYDSAAVPIDWEKNPSAPVEELSPEALDEGAKIAQLIADEMGPDVPVVFEKRRFVSFSPPTNPHARQALEDHISELHPGMNDDVRGVWWAADWPPPPQRAGYSLEFCRPRR